jgi:signal transduction histidine kinase/putative methionine-R-sulfoxide reductase with GAF domain
VAHRARVVPDLLTPLATAASLEAGLAQTLERLVTLAGATAGALVFRPPRASAPVLTDVGPASQTRTLRALLLEGAPAPRGVLRAPLGEPAQPVGEVALAGRRPLRRAALPVGFARDLGVALPPAWEFHRRALRLRVLDDLTRLVVSSDSLDDVLRVFAQGLATLVTFDSLAVALVDAERDEFEVIDVAGRNVSGIAPRDGRLPVEKTLLAEVVAGGMPVRVDDLTAAGVPESSRAALTARGWRSIVLAPLISRDKVFGAVSLVSARRAGFDDGDVESVVELARPLASAIEQRRLVDESRRRAEELSALYSTSQLITSRLDVASVLDRIARSVTSLIGSTGCGIGLLDASRARLVHAAAHGYKSGEWRALALPVGEGIMGRAAETEAPLRVDDVRRDPRSARRDVDEREGIRSMLCVPLRVAGQMLGVISAFSTRPSAFTAHHQRVLEAFAEQAGIAVQNAQLFEESVRRARETRALLEAGRAVTASLDLGRTITVIMEQARAVLGVHSCSIMTLDPQTRTLAAVASLDLPQAMATTIRVKEGQGVSGEAVAELRPKQSADLWSDPRVQFPELPRASGLRSMLTAPLRVGAKAIGAILVFRQDVHVFTPAEEELLLALADQAAIAMEHARLYENLEGMVAERTLELDRQKRFVEVVLETLPLGVFVLDGDLRVARVNREGARTLASEAPSGRRLDELLPPGLARDVEGFVRLALARGAVDVVEHDVGAGGEAKMLRFTAAPLDAGGEGGGHVVLLVEDVTRAKHLERQMLLTERLTTAGRLAAGVAHELNNPLATIAGCAESLSSRLKDNALAARPELADFPSYLALIEEEAFRCKEITGSLLQFVREPGHRRAHTDVNALVQKTIELLSHQSRFAGSRFATDLDPELPRLVINEGQFRQVFLGIASNGLEAMEGRGGLSIRTRRVRGEVHVEFVDEGPGMPPDVLARIFDPFFTTKPPGQGTGLGLAIAQSIVADHGGRIEVESRVAAGTVFRVVLPE